MNIHLFWRKSYTSIKNLPLGSGIGSPNSCAVSIQNAIDRIQIYRYDRDSYDPQFGTKGWIAAPLINRN